MHSTGYISDPLVVWLVAGFSHGASAGDQREGGECGGDIYSSGSLPIESSHGLCP